MTFFDIKHKDYIQQAYGNAVAHGWHDEQKPDDHWLMLIVTEIAEAIQADRHDKRANVLAYETDTNRALGKSYMSNEAYETYCNESFEAHIKDTLEDEFADIIIRIYDFIGVKNFDFPSTVRNKKFQLLCLDYSDSVDICCSLTSFFRRITKLICNSSCADMLQISVAMFLVNEYAFYKGIDLYYFVRLKMNYNKTRPFRHNAKY